MKTLSHFFNRLNEWCPGCRARRDKLSALLPGHENRMVGKGRKGPPMEEPMSAFGPFLRRGTGYYSHWCPGCDQAHVIMVDAEGPGPRWTFNGDENAPTFDPSVRVSDSARDADGKQVRPIQWVTSCHYFIRAGNIEFCGDSAHALAGKTVPLPPWPEKHKDWHDG